MRIHHYDTDQTFDTITLFLTEEEAENLINYLQNLLDHPENHHFHCRGSEIGKSNFKEITGAIYSEKNINTFDARSKKLILEDK